MADVRTRVALRLAKWAWAGRGNRDEVLAEIAADPGRADDVLIVAAQVAGVGLCLAAAAGLVLLGVVELAERWVFWPGWALVACGGGLAAAVLWWVRDARRG